MDQPQNQSWEYPIQDSYIIGKTALFIVIAYVYSFHLRFETYLQ